MKGKEKDKLGKKSKHDILKALLNAMEEHRKDETVMRNGCITICQFKIPADVVSLIKGGNTHASEMV